MLKAFIRLFNNPGLFFLSGVLFAFSAVSCGGGGGGGGSSVINYEVSFYDDDGSPMPEYGGPVANGTQITLPVPANGNNTFDGWLLNGTEEALTGSYTVSADTVFIAKWTKPGLTEYRISFYDDGKVLPNYSKSAGSGAVIPLPVPPAKTGYTFNGWLLNGTGELRTGDYTVSANAVFIAEWTVTNPGVTEYTVTFYDDGNILPGHSKNIAGGTRINLPVLTKTDYIFNGWLLNGTGEALTGSHTVNTDTIFIAKWTAEGSGVTLYSVSFYDDSGKVMPDYSKNAAGGTQIDLPALTRAGYSFDGWFLNDMGEPLAGEHTVTGNLSFHAKFTKQYMVEYYDYDGSPISTEQINSGINITLTARSREGHNFDGWLLNDTETLVPPGDYTVTGNLSFHAKYTIKTYRVSYYDKYGRKYGDIGGEADHGTDIIMPGRSKTGYNFDGWFLDNIGEPIYETDTFQVTDNVSFYAKFTLPGAVPISDAANLNTIRDGLSGKYILTDNISLSGLDWEPISTFTGVLDGNGHKITDLTAEKPFAGLFGSISDGVINDLTIEVISVKGESHAGGLAGVITGTAEISDVYITGTGMIRAEPASGGAYAGGLAGELSGNITLSGCGNNNNVSAISGGYNASYSGGIAGFMVGTATNCYSSGKISASGYVSRSGGIAGHMIGTATVRDSYNTGEISPSAPSNRSYSGGIAGYMTDTATVRDSYNTGEVSPYAFYSHAGGIAGFMNGTATIRDSYNIGEVSAKVLPQGYDSYSGGIAGYMTGTAMVRDNYNTGEVSASGSSSYSGGIAGMLNGAAVEILNNAAINTEIDAVHSGRIIGYSDSEDPSHLRMINNFAFKSMMAVGDGIFDDTDAATHGTSKTNNELKDRATYESAVEGDGDGGLGWLFGDDDEHPWKMPDGYPLLYWQE